MTMESSEVKLNHQAQRLTRDVIKTMKQQNARVFKWKEMLEQYPEKKNQKLKDRGRKGIPDSMRGYAW